MSDITELAHLDTSPSDLEIHAAKALIAAEMKTLDTTAIHPDIQKRYNHEPNFSPMIRAAHDAIARNGGELVSFDSIDASRYEAPEAPADLSDTEAMKTSLKRAYTSSMYMQGRHENLQALEENGRNAWLISNNDLEQELRGLEAILKKAKARMNEISEERRLGQESVRGELEGLEETWRSSLGRAIEAEIATQHIRGECLEKRRKLANGQAVNSRD